MCDTKNTEMAFPKKQRCGGATRKIPLEEDFIMSASAPFTYSVHSQSGSSLASQPVKWRDANTPVPPQQPLRDAPIHHTEAGVIGTNQADTSSPKNVMPTTTAAESAAAAAPSPPPLLLPTLVMTHGNNSEGAGNGIGSLNAKADATPDAGGIPSPPAAAAAEVRTAMSPTAAAGRLAYVADVTARVQRMRMRGRRAPEVALASAASWAISSDSTSPASPPSLNLDVLPLVTGLHLPRRIKGPLRPKI